MKVFRITYHDDRQKIKHLIVETVSSALAYVKAQMTLSEKCEILKLRELDEKELRKIRFHEKKSESKFIVKILKPNTYPKIIFNYS